MSLYEITLDDDSDKESRVSVGLWEISLLREQLHNNT